MTIVSLGLAPDDQSGSFRGDYIGNAGILEPAPLVPAMPLRGESGGGGTHMVAPSAEMRRLQVEDSAIPLETWKHIETYKGFKIEVLRRPNDFPLFRGVQYVPGQTASHTTGTYLDRTKAYSDVDKLAARENTLLPDVPIKGPLQKPTLNNQWVLVEDYKGLRIEKDNLGSHFRVTQMHIIPNGEMTQNSVRGGFPTVEDARNFIDSLANAPIKRQTLLQSGIARDRLATQRANFRSRLNRLKTEWGPEGRVQTYKGVRILRAHRKISGPDGEKVTVPIYRTKQRLVGVRQTGPEGVSGLGVTEPAGIVEAETLDQIKQLIDTHPLAPNERGEPDGIGPAFESIRVQQLPGELDIPLDAPLHNIDPALPVASIPEMLRQHRGKIALGVLALGALFLHRR